MSHWVKKLIRYIEYLCYTYVYDSQLVTESRFTFTHLPCFFDVSACRFGFSCVSPVHPDFCWRLLVEAFTKKIRYLFDNNIK